jgi:long-chain fatty acid transport protein
MSQRSQYKKFISLLAAGVLPVLVQPAWSSGFALNEQNASGLGTAYAGAASIAEDASTGYYNVAGLTRLGEEQIVGSAVGILPRANLTVTGARATFPQAIVAGAPVNLGVGSTKTRPIAVVPSIHYAKRLSDNWVFGLSVASPFGLKTHYPDNSIARYIATRSEVETVNIGPGLAYDFRNGLSVGAGIDAMYAMAKLDTRIGVGNAARDGFLENTASNWGVGYHAGILYQFTDCTRIGLTYRSKIKVNPRGEAVTQFLPVGLQETRLGVRSHVTFPESVAISGYHDFNADWAIMADVQWTRWTHFKTLTLRYFDEGSRLRLTQNFKNTIRSSVGITYQVCEPLKLKIGSAYDRTPTNDTWRSIRIPDQNRIWAALGAQYRFTKCLALDVGYAHIFFKKARINETAPALVTPGSINRIQSIQSITGTSKGRADLIGIQLTWDLV